MDSVEKVLMLPVGLCILVAIGLTIRIIATDARRRGKSPLLVILLIVLCFPGGFIAWLLFRPDPLEGKGNGGQFRLEDHRIQ
jgi:hypothetical protein